MGNIEKINQQIWNLWCEYCDQSTIAKIPMVYPKPNKQTILFIGLNPSFSEPDVRNHLRDTGHEKCADCSTLFHFQECRTCPNDEPFVISKDEYSEAREQYKRYFNPLKHVAKEVGLEKEFDHIDIFMWREKNASELPEMIYTNPYGRCLSPFWLEQLKLCKLLIKEANPLCIVVVNKMASEILAFNSGSEVILNAKKDFPGVNEIMLGRKKIPTIFFKQLSGGGTTMQEKEDLIFTIQELLKGLKVNLVKR
ncbi:MAG: hypothetical protein KJ720_02410 [Proteobacteria bacterium]|nr:hypothetical protein [Pseudomonadota bacterium]MBU1450458.1 hypothetical protein [Pseudomonadota bacterium]MBU2470260.1 hypothetical protein [Pseudomonadota bacterium]MBU2519368.1 hypothetical protein [Pseudomonadota bacterium]